MRNTTVKKEKIELHRLSQRCSDRTRWNVHIENEQGRKTVYQNRMEEGDLPLSYLVSMHNKAKFSNLIFSKEIDLTLHIAILRMETVVF